MNSGPAPPSSERLDSDQTRTIVRASLLLLFTYVFLANAWLGDDAHITFRVVWNFVRGYGLRFNPDERVQAFTHPLWTLVLSAAHLVTREFYLTATVLSWAFCVAAGFVLLRRARSLPHAALLVGWLLSSKAFVDYTSSGLEYPLSYFLLALFYARYLDRPSQAPVEAKELRWFVLLGALGFLNRPDAVLLFLVPLADLAFRGLRTRGRAIVAPASVGLLPALAWTGFSTFYYGFPLPNTFYAKAANGIPSWLMQEQGLAYLLNSLRFDPITLGTIALAVAVGWRIKGPALRAACSAALYAAYTVWVGGDFMSGRFFAMPFFLSVMIVVPVLARSLTPWFAGGLVLYNLLVPIVPIKTKADYDGAWPWRTQNGIKDERGYSHLDSNPLGFSPFRPMMDTPFAREGMSFAASDEKVSVYCCIGLYGLMAGPDKHVIDENALSDPLLAHLPVSPRVYFEFWASHYFRDLPEGYVESVERDENLIADPVVHEFYDRLRHVTRGPLLDLSRLRDIWALNLGRDRDVAERFEHRREVVLEFSAGHPRFLTDVGVKNPRTGALETMGRSGYLQYGPGIPMKAGSYRAQWVGTTDQPPGADLGYVEVWDGAHRIAREPIVCAAHVSPPGVLAYVDFTLPQDVRRLDYRFWVAGGVEVSLEHIDLYSATAVPLEH